MQPLGFSSPESVAQAAAQGWFSRAEAHAERAARIGFVLSMIFFAAAALYGLALSSVTRPYFERLFELVDNAATKAGFRIESLSITGNRNAPSKVLLTALQLPYSGSILSYDTGHARDRLLKLGWIETAEVRRILPSRLEIVVTERVPFARWATDEKILLIDRDGRVLGEDVNGKFSRLLLVAGDNSPKEALALSEALSGRDQLWIKIEQAEFVAERFWALKLTNGLIAKLPLKVNASCLDRLEGLLASDKIADISLGSIDLRLPDRTILQLKEPTIANRDKAITSFNSVNSAPHVLAAPPHRVKPL